MIATIRLTFAILALPLFLAHASDEGGPRYSAAWGTEGSGDGQFHSPTSLAFDSVGNVYVVDQGNHRIQKFTSQGRFLAQWGRSGTANSEFLYPTAVAVSARDEVFVTDQMNSRVQVFDTSGVYLRKWGSEGTAPGQFVNPTGIAVNEEGFVFVADPANRRVQRFTSDGALVAVWGPELPGDRTWGQPAAVACAGSGRVYVADSEANLLMTFRDDGELLIVQDLAKMLGLPFHRLVDVSVDPDGNILLLDAGHAGSVFGGEKDPQIVIIREDGITSAHFGVQGQGIGALSQPSALNVGSNGWIYVADSHNDRIQIFAEEQIELWQSSPPVAKVAGAGIMAAGSRGAIPTPMEVWGSRGSDPGQCKSPAGVAATPDSAIYVADSGNHRIQKWNQAGGFSLEWGRKGGNAGEFRSPADVAVGADGSVFVADRDNHRIQVFSQDGDFLRAWGAKGSQERQFREPVSLATDRKGFVYVADAGNRRIQKFRGDGEFVAAWGPKLTGKRKLEMPGGLCVDADNNLLVVDAESKSVHRFDPDGMWIGSTDLNEVPDLDVYSPVAIEIDSAGYLYLLDQGRMPEPFKTAEDARLLVLSPGDSLVDRLGKNGADPGEFDTPSGLAVDPSGRILVADSGNNRIQVFAWMPEGAAPEIIGPEPEIPPRIVREISIAIWKPILDVEGDRLTMGLVTPAVEWSLSDRVSVVGRMPFARQDFGSGSGETALGNPYMGIRFGPSNRGTTDIGIWVPVASRDNSSALLTGFVSDVDRWEAYLPQTLTLQAESLGELAPHPSLALGLRLAITWSVYTGGGGGTSWLPYGGWLRYHSHNFRARGGVTGRLHPSFSNGVYVVNRTQILLRADFGPWRLRPGLALRLWLNGDFRELVPAVLGLTLNYDFRR